MTAVQLRAARDQVRALQRAAARSMGHLQPANGPVFEESIRWYKEYSATQPTEIPGFVRRGAFVFPEKLEAARVRHGEEVIRRVEPGPDEDPTYLALLARQAASIEIADNDKPYDAYSKILIGTLGAADVNAFSRRIDSHGYSVVMLNSGIIDFIYQAAKVAVEATNPIWVGEGPPVVTSSVSPEGVEEGLRENTGPIDRLYETLEAYFFHGYPRARANEHPPLEHHAPLSLLVNFAERWIIGHEYGHAVLPSIDDSTGDSSGENTEWVKEYTADAFGIVGTVLSAKHLDGVPPEFPLGGAIFALSCLDLRQRALHLIQTGDEHWVSDGGSTHPAPSERLARVVPVFRSAFDVTYDDPHRKFKLTYPRVDVDGVHGFTSERALAAFSYANALEVVWTMTRQRLLLDHNAKRPLHKMWL